jgi:hypothetical protein
MVSQIASISSSVVKVDVLGEAEHRRPLPGVVTADPFEDAGAVMERVAQHVDGRLLEIDELAVLPDPADTVEGVGHGEASF